MSAPSVPSATQLGYLVAALDHGTWTDAADALNVSSSAFSQGIAELERRLGGVQLFSKDGRRRVPTESAVVVGQHARRILDAYGSLERWSTVHAAGGAGVVRAGMIDTAAIHHFSDALIRFRSLHGDVELHLSAVSYTHLTLPTIYSV